MWTPVWMPVGAGQSRLAMESISPGARQLQVLHGVYVSLELLVHLCEVAGLVMAQLAVVDEDTQDLAVEGPRYGLPRAHRLEGGVDGALQDACAPALDGGAVHETHRGETIPEHAAAGGGDAQVVAVVLGAWPEKEGVFPVEPAEVIAGLDAGQGVLQEVVVALEGHKILVEARSSTVQDRSVLAVFLQNAALRVNDSGVVEELLDVARGVLSFGVVFRFVAVLSRVRVVIVHP